MWGCPHRACRPGEGPSGWIRTCPADRDHRHHHPHCPFPRGTSRRTCSSSRPDPRCCTGSVRRVCSCGCRTTIVTPHDCSLDSSRSETALPSRRRRGRTWRRCRERSPPPLLRCAARTGTRFAWIRLQGPTNRWCRCRCIGAKG